jgi:adenine/guanine/hypoxanthine permease
MPLTFSIATGLSLGVLALTFVKLGSGKYREVSPLVWILAILFALRYAFPAVSRSWARNSLDY